MSRLFTVEKTRVSHLRETYVMWDMDGYSIPAENLFPYTIREQIKSRIEKEGFYGPVSFSVYGCWNTWSTELENRLCRADFDTNLIEGGKLERLHAIIVDLVASSCLMFEPTNLLIVSENKEMMEQNRRFSRLREALEGRGFTITVAQLETLMDPEFQMPYYIVADDDDDLDSRGCSQEAA